MNVGYHGIEDRSRAIGVIEGATQKETTKQLEVIERSV